MPAIVLGAFYLAPLRKIGEALGMTGKAILDGLEGIRENWPFIVILGAVQLAFIGGLFMIFRWIFG